MNAIAFIDTEIDYKTKKIQDFGCIRTDGNFFHSHSRTDFIRFLKGAAFLCGHNIINHDLKFIEKDLVEAGINPSNVIDTLYLSPLLFPSKPYHSLLKDDKLQTDEINNPLNDSIKARDLFFDEVTAFHQLDENLKIIFLQLLNEHREFHSFFQAIDLKCEKESPEILIRNRFRSEICDQANLSKIISDQPVELSYCLSLISANNRYSITPPWVLKNFPEVHRIMHVLRNQPCVSGCTYCNRVLNIHRGLKRFFGFDSFKTFGGEPLQEKAIQAAVDGKSLLAVFPTGGGKSITFQVPALMSGESVKGLTVIISPLQSLMKDQVDNLEKIGITDAVTINGLLDPIEKAKSFERVEDGSASILYISPESLRSTTIERLLLGRKIIRFVIDEAHCFSSWGQDFRVDYLYIGDFIKSIQTKKQLEIGIPVSCFTATAKRKVIEDIREYFKQKLALNLELFTSKTSRSNLHYKVFNKNNEEEKYQAVRDLIEEKNCPVIIYVSRTRKAYSLAERLTNDGFNARPYHGKMEVREKTANQNAFISGEVSIMVATSAFGMGVDKKDVGMVIHYEISDSLENYIQEAGRAGRDESNTADCFVLYNEEDLSKHFILLNQTKLSIKEIQQIWKAIQKITKYRLTVSNSALEIARKAGWDDGIAEIESRVTSAIAALEEAGYLKRGQNMPRIFANSILSKNAQEAIEKIYASERFEEKQKEKAIRIIRKLFSSKSRKQVGDEQAESRIDHISDHLGIVKEEVIGIVNLLKEEKILADTRDLSSFIKRGDQKNHSLSILESFAKIESFLLPRFDTKEKTFHIKELNEQGEEYGCNDISPGKIKTILNFWAIKNWIKRQTSEHSKNHITVQGLQPSVTLLEKLQKRHELARFVVDYLFEKSSKEPSKDEAEKEMIMIGFSVHELKDEFDQRLSLFKTKISIEDVEDTLFYLSRIEALKIEGGFLVIYNRLTIERLEKDNKKRYKAEDYQKLSQFYENKVQQIHIVGEYAKRMINDYKDALQFVDDYFQLNYSSFLNKYFKGSRQEEIRRNLTPAKFKQLFGNLSPTQLKIINDNISKYIVVAAGPGSGKTRVLVHKLASLLLMEDIKHEQLLMITFSRAAATEFKKRLLNLIGNAANFIEIKTFHSYCFDLLGKVGSLEKSDDIIKRTIEKIRNADVEPGRITKTVLVIDEAQDINSEEYELINTLIDLNDDMRVIAVGDDDQNIFEFRGASSKYLEQFILERNAIKYELIENFRSGNNLVEFTNQFVTRIKHRLKNIQIVGTRTDDGIIRVVRYQSNNLITPVVTDILASPLAGTTCVLTKSNEEALQITGLLLKNGMQARLIQSNDGFNLQNLLEVRFFLTQLNQADDVFMISDEVWENAKRELKNRFQNSTKYEICTRMITDFEETNPKKRYKSDFEVFIRESKLEDFYNETGETVIVSTIHKAKGKEFDQVFLMLDNVYPGSDEICRQLYVAMTRAKQNLTIHLNGNWLDNLKSSNLLTIEDATPYLPPNQMVMQLTFKDVWLDYFIYRQPVISQLISGDTLTINGNELLDSKGYPVLRFSTLFLKQIETINQKNYQLKEACVNFIVYWQKEDTGQEVKIILPELTFERNKQN